MNAKFTPGPWKTHPYDNLAIVQDQGEYVGKQITAIHHYSGTKKTESCANARLIAAAPDMYEALKLLQSALTEYRLRDTKKRYSLCVADAAASQALAKAEGM